jgi:hypothetical protein
MLFAGGLIGGAILIVAALALFAGGDDNGGNANRSAGPQEFDPNFAPTFTDGPRVEVLPTDVLDYGDVEFNKMVNAVFTVRNVGDEPLVVLGEPQVELIQGC